MGCSQRETVVVVLGALLVPGVPRHGRCHASELRHHPVQTLLHGGRLVLFEVGRNFVELSNDSLAAQASAELVVPGPERPGGGLQLFDVSLAEPSVPAGRIGCCGGLEPCFERVEEGGATDHGTGQGARRCASVHHEVAPGQFRCQVHGRVGAPGRNACHTFTPTPSSDGPPAPNSASYADPLTG